MDMFLNKNKSKTIEIKEDLAVSQGNKKLSLKIDMYEKELKKLEKSGK